jgi:hypothetical protein
MLNLSRIIQLSVLFFNLNSAGSSRSICQRGFRFEKPVGVRTLSGQLNQSNLSIGSPIKDFVALSNIIFFENFY